ncbi:hypothetical protein GEM_1850 [Burkholderia cepacia GG4]|uniref:Uncharacterized protein n=1 Tax=Burkholderia cepacia GG4 TaxID=1009846 RepID=A0A9W3K152_BURCE|nr:hypothetical protein GEM_1850 [Burkholderia cepacia GG4]
MTLPILLAASPRLDIRIESFARLHLLTEPRSVRFLLLLKRRVPVGLADSMHAIDIGQ